MAGTITRFAIQDADFCTLANGNETAILVYQAPFGATVVAFYVRWVWDFNFTPLAGYSVEADETSLIKEILTSAGIWNQWAPTWAQLESGEASYISGGQVFNGGMAVAVRFQDWTKGQTVEVCENATKDQWFRDFFMAELQVFSDQVYGSLATPPPPPPRPSPTDLFPPQAVGAIQSAMGLLMAHVTRLTYSRDPANGNRPVVGAIPVPS